MEPVELDTRAAEGLIDSGRFEEAIAFLAERARVERLDARGEFLLGLAFRRAGRPSEAVEAYRRCVALEPGVAVAWRGIAALSFDLGNYADVVDSLERYLDLEPYDRAALGWAIFSLAELQRLDDAHVVLDRYLAVFPYDARLRPMQAFLFERQRRFLNAVLMIGSEADQALANSMAGEILHNCMNNLGNSQLCEAYLELTYPDPVHREQDFAYAKGVAHLAALKDDLPTSVAMARRSIQLGNSDRDATLNLALLEIANNDYAEGWLAYRNRDISWKHLILPSISEWNGEPIAGKTIIVHSEQGCGDVIQFVRYLPYLRETGATVLFNSYADILELLRNDPRAQKGQSIAVDVLQQIDYQTFLMEFPVLLRARSILDFPADTPYLYAPPAKVDLWRQRLAEYPGLRVGLVWAGNPQHENDHNRSVSLTDLRDLAAVPGIAWFSVQKGPRSSDLGADQWPRNIVDLADEIDDFSDTAAILEALDLLISVDTSVAHLAGAMERPCWVLIPKVGEDWRWRIADDRSPWYPALRLFKQKRACDWRGVVADEIVPRLAERVAECRVLPLSSRQRIELAWLAGDPIAEDALKSWLDDCPIEEIGPDSIRVARFLALRRQEPAPLGILAAHSGGNPEIMAAFAEWQASRGNSVEALDSFLMLGDRIPSDEAVLVCGRLLINSGQVSRADVIISAAVGRRGLTGALARLQGDVAYSRQEWNEAGEAYSRAVHLDPRSYSAYLGLSRVLRIQRNFVQAGDALQRALLLNREDIGCWREVVQFALDRGASCFAEHAARWLLSQSGDTQDKVYLALALARQGRAGEAQALVVGEKFAAIDDLAGKMSLVYLYALLGQDESTEKLLREIVSTYPRLKHGHLELGTWLLARNRFEEGWEHYRLGLPEETLPAPEWRGERLEGKTLLVFQDQGHGDLLQFLPLVAQLPVQARITLAVYADVFEFVAAQFPAFPVIRREKVLVAPESYDFCVPLMRLPGLLGVDLEMPPLAFPYYRAVSSCLPDEWVDVLRADTRLKVGIVWAGNSQHPNDANRSTSLEDWLPLAELPGLSLYSLQKDVASNQAQAFPQLVLRNLASVCDRLHQTAAAISHLDLVISVDSAVAHLAAALGKETWILVPDKRPDFRWQLGREDCPWYPTVRLIRRSAAENWVDVLTRIAQSLNDRLANPS